LGKRSSCIMQITVESDHSVGKAHGEKVAKRTPCCSGKGTAV
jgi:hypothetical protein